LISVSTIPTTIAIRIVRLRFRRSQQNAQASLIHDACPARAESSEQVESDASCRVEEAVAM
jgi:hypothetical protein